MNEEVKALLYNLEHGLSVEFMIEEIRKSIKEYRKMKKSNRLFKSIDISPFLTGDLLEMYEDIERHMARNDASVLALKEKQISVMKAGILAYAEKHYSPERFESIRNTLNGLKL